MTEARTREVEDTVRTYLQTREKADAGEVGWDAVAEFFTEGATFIDPGWGRFEGRRNIRQFLRDSMQGLDGWSFPTEWIIIQGDRVVIKFLNRLPGRRTDGTYYEAPGVQLLDYAGNGRFSREEDIINMVHLMEVIRDSAWVPGPGFKTPKEVVR